jgi:cytochrome c oxidase assembly factor CtaG
MRRLAALLVLTAFAAAGPASAHVAAPQPGWRGPEAWMLVPTLLALALYGLGYLRLFRRSGPGRGELGRRGRLFLAGMAVLGLATLSPLHALGARSFTAHMAEHELIMLGAAPLLVLARPLPVLFWALPAPLRRMLARVPRSAAGAGTWRVLTDPLLATVLQAAALWIWHLPSLFDRALNSEGWHAAQHLSFFVTALLFWQAMLSPRRSPWTAAALLFATSMVTGALGAFMALSESPWYAPYAALGLAAFGLSPAQDQQLAGVLMWVPGGLFHAVVAIVLLAPALRAGGREAVHG